MSLLRAIFIASIIAFVVPISGIAADTVHTEREKAKLVSRFYQITYGSSEKCKSAPLESAKKFQTVLDRFLATNEKIMALVVNSPHYAAAQTGYAKYATLDTERDTPESLTQECEYMATFMSWLIDSPYWPRMVKEHEEMLSQ